MVSFITIPRFAILIRYLVITSPEIAVSKLFHHDVLNAEVFRFRVSLLALDEVHLMEDWGKGFRTDYAKLGVLRTRLPSCVPVLGVSATLPFVTLASVIRRGRFRNPKVHRHSIDRPEIYIQVEPLQNTKKSMLDLRFVLPEVVRGPLDIPKTIVYMNTIGEIRRGLIIIRRWMVELGYASEAFSWVRAMHSLQAENTKLETAALFGQISSECLLCRIVLATDAYGLGVDNPDVEIVVQWLIPPDMSALNQRAGRAMRSGEKSAFFILLHELRVLEPQTAVIKDVALQSTSQNAGTSSQAPRSSLCHVETAQHPGGKKSQRVKGFRMDAASIKWRQSLAPGLIDFVNCKSCFRRQVLKYFGNNTYHANDEGRKIERCCSHCSPEYMVDRQTSTPQRPTGDLWRAQWVRSQLRSWRSTETPKLFKSSMLPQVDTVLLSDERIHDISTYCNHIEDRQTLLRFGGFWAEAEDYSDKVIELCQRARNANPLNSDIALFCNTQNRNRRAHSALSQQSVTSNNSTGTQASIDSQATSRFEASEGDEAPLSKARPVRKETVDDDIPPHIRSKRAEWIESQQNTRKGRTTKPRSTKVAPTGPLIQAKSQLPRNNIDEVASDPGAATLVPIPVLQMPKISSTLPKIITNTAVGSISLNKPESRPPLQAIDHNARQITTQKTRKGRVTRPTWKASDL